MEDATVLTPNYCITLRYAVTQTSIFRFLLHAYSDF